MAGHAQEQPTLYYLSFPIESQLLAVCGNPSRLTVALACRTDITQQQSTRVRSWIAILGAAGELLIPKKSSSLQIKGFASFRLKVYIADGINK